MGYVGATFQLGKRLKCHARRQPTLLGNALRFHGASIADVTVYVLETGVLDDARNRREKYWVTLLNTTHPRGYNSHLCPAHPAGNRKNWAGLLKKVR